jgi:hypothetical protein
MRGMRSQTKLILALALSLPTAAHAADDDGSGGFVEGVVGASMPLGDDAHDDAADNSIKLGLHAGAWTGPQFGVELSADWTPINEASNPFFEATLDTYRVQIGIRGGTLVGEKKNVLVFGRALAGIDILHVDIESIIGNDSDTDTGLALEAGLGVLVDLGPLALGAQLAVPIGMHWDDEDDAADDYLDYTATDLNFMFTVSSSL